MTISKRWKLKKFKVIYFTGDYFSSKGEKINFTILLAESEEEAESMFYRLYENCSIGWIEEVS